MSGARILAVCGVIASVCSMAGGFLDMPVLMGIGGAVMLFGNIAVSFKG